MIGPHGGKGGTVKIENFTDHIPVSLLSVLCHSHEASAHIAYDETAQQVQNWSGGEESIL